MTTEKKPLVDRRIGFKVHVGYLVELDTIQKLYEKGWKVAHNTATQFEFRKQDENGAWVIDQDSNQFYSDYFAAKGEAPHE